MPESVKNDEQHWHAWAISYWGTKWDLEPGQIYVERDRAGDYRLIFDTAWSPPRAIHGALLDKIDEQGWDISVTWFYDEPAMGCAGYL